MIENNFNDIDEWIFPEVEITPNQITDIPPVLSEELQEELNEITHSEEQENQENTEEVEVPLLEANEIETIKAEYSEKIAVIDTIMARLKYPMSIIDDELIEVILDLVKKTVAKIIHKEIDTDKNLINRMIQELVGLMQEKDGMVTIYTSSHDYQNLNKENEQQFKLMNVDESLKQGDIIIKSNFSEVRAILNERIDNLLRIQYD